MDLPIPMPMDPSTRAETTFRALFTGCLIGAVLAAGNVYTGLKIGMIDGGSITAALLGFTLFSTVTRLGRTPYTALENNITQTTAASAAVMGFVAGVGGPVPAMALLGRNFPGWALAIWGMAIGIIGIFAATLLRRKLVVEDALPFPTGNATGELIETMFAGRQSALRRARFLLMGALVAMAVTWFRDGRPSLIPGTTAFGGAIAGMLSGLISSLALIAISPQSPDHSLSITEKAGLTFDVLSDARQEVIAAYRVQFTVPADIKDLHLNVFGNDPSAQTADGSWNLPIPATFVIDTFLLLLIGIGPKIALVPFLETTRQMPEATQRRVLRKMLITAATVAVLLLV